MIFSYLSLLKNINSLSFFILLLYYYLQDVTGFENKNRRKGAYDDALKKNVNKIKPIAYL